MNTLLLMNLTFLTCLSLKIVYSKIDRVMPLRSKISYNVLYYFFKFTLEIMKQYKFSNNTNFSEETENILKSYIILASSIEKDFWQQLSKISNFI